MGKKISFVLFSLVALMNCSNKWHISGMLYREKELNYLYVSVPEDLDLVLTIRNDKTFQIKDVFGHLGMFQNGIWSFDDGKIILIADTSNCPRNLSLYNGKTYTYYKRNEELFYTMDLSYFAPLCKDTINVIDNKTLSLRGLVFHFIEDEYSIEKKMDITRDFYRKKLENSIEDVFDGDTSAYFNYIEELIDGIIFYRP